MTAGIVAEAAGLFAVSNVDDILMLALFFGRSAGQPSTGQPSTGQPSAGQPSNDRHSTDQHRATRRIVAGQYLGFALLLAISVAAAYGATFLPASALAYLGLLPLALGLRAAWAEWRDRRRADPGEREPAEKAGGPKALHVAAVAFANGSDNIGVYTPVFATAGAAGISVYAAVFLVLVGVWCAAGRFFATRPSVALVIQRWGHVLQPLVLIALGLFILVRGGAFGL